MITCLYVCVSLALRLYKNMDYGYKVRLKKDHSMHESPSSPSPTAAVPLTEQQHGAGGDDEDPDARVHGERVVHHE